MDVSKLSGAPWNVATTSDAVFDETNHKYKITSERKPTYCVASVEGMGEGSKDDAEFIALARNAFDVMMRRGWGVLPCRSVIGWWVSKDSEGNPFRDDAPRLYWQDPYTALIEADRWYKENVESREGNPMKRPPSEKENA